MDLGGLDFEVEAVLGKTFIDGSKIFLYSLFLAGLPFPSPGMGDLVLRFFSWNTEKILHSWFLVLPEKRQNWDHRRETPRERYGLVFVIPFAANTFTFPPLVFAIHSLNIC